MAEPTPTSIEIPGYTFIRPLGRGGMGEVHLARQQSLGREIALKLLAPALAHDPHARERFVREARIAAQLQHPHIVPIYEVGTHGDTAFIAMEYEPGGSVAVPTQPADDALTALRIVRDVADALDYAHGHGVVHRDVKPENVLRRGSGQCMLSDFGIARAAAAVTIRTQEGACAGTPPYMSPEQLRGYDIDGRADLYSLGVMLYQLLTGALPFQGGDVYAIGMQHLNAPVPRLPAAFAHVQALVDVLMAKEPSQRPARGAEVVTRIEAMLGRVTPMVTQPITQPDASSDRPSIAILPFANLGGDSEQGYFSDGVSEDLITELSRWRRLAVRSRSSSFRYRGDAVDLKQAARELDVRFIVEGSVRRMGTQLRIAVQLIDAESGSHVWAEKFDRDASDIFAVQDQVVRRIASTVMGRVEAQDVVRARRKPPASLGAYELVLKGNALSWDDPAGAAEARRLFEQAIELDPGYGYAHALLSSMRGSQWLEAPEDRDDLLEEAYALATRAVKLDENESTCFALLGHTCWHRHAFDMAQQHLQRAVELNPNSQWNAADYGLLLVHIGQAAQALTWFARAREIDPYFDQPWYWRALAKANMVLERYPEALAALERSNSRYYVRSALAAGCHARLGQDERAVFFASECIDLNPGFSVARFLRRSPFREPQDEARMRDSLLMAGLPE